IDLSARQIDMGRSVATRLGLDNLELKALSILDVDESFGTFDYIFAHGVYSWVPERGRDKLLAICRRHLSANGGAYIRYNTYPGWYQRGRIQDLLNYAPQGVAEPVAQIATSRKALTLLMEGLINPESVYGRIVKEEADLLGKEKDYYLLHEHLEGSSHPLYFHQFAAHAGRHGLQYLGEAGPHAPFGGVAPAVAERTPPRSHAPI